MRHPSPARQRPMGATSFVLTAAAALAAIVAVERRWPLRSRREDEAPHVIRNLAVVAITAVTTAIVERVVLAPIQQIAERKRLGLLRALPLSDRSRTIAGFLLLDYTLWWWHWLNHKWQALWRFHLVHHTDLDLDASTALRFHFGEMAMSVLYRAGQVLVFGIDSGTLRTWQRALIVSVLFHHSNLRLPVDVDRRLAAVLVTPLMHGIHHSDWRNETDSNWSSILSWWDHIHGTLRLDVHQAVIRIGVPAWQDPSELTLPRLMTLPFAAQRNDWVDASGQLRINREAASSPADGVRPT